MKKIFLIIIGIISGLFLGMKGVNASVNDSTLRTEYIDNVYVFHYRNGVLTSYGKLPYKYINGNLAYCIDSATVLGTYTYSSTDDWNISGYTEEEKRQMELISYYGYGYEGHNTVQYYMATQELIWLFRDSYVKWTKAYSENAEQMEVEKEKKEILDLVNKHYIMPSFTNNQYNKEYSSTFTLKDSNNVLKNYNVTGNLNFIKSDTSLKIDANKFGEYTFKLNHKRNVQNNTTVYYSSGIASQMMAVFGLNDVNANFKVLVDKAFLRIYKRDINTKELIKGNGTVFSIKDVNNNVYINQNLTVNQDGYAEILLPVGIYEINEKKASNGYVINRKNIVVTIDENMKITNNAYEIDFYNETPKGSIKVLKLDENKNKLPGVLIGLFDEKYNLINTLYTTLSDDIFSDLKLGTYYLKELDTLEGYRLDDKYYKVDIKYKDDKTYVIEENLEIINKKIKCDIVYITSYKDTILEGVEINVYDSNNKLVFSGKTNKEGKVVIKDLPYGKYYIKQVKVPKGYLISEDSYEFYVNDSTCISSIDVENEKTIMPVTTTSLDTSIGLGIVLLLIGIHNFVKKSN